jgi:type IV pilus assembly protein PilF
MKTALVFKVSLLCVATALFSGCANTSNEKSELPALNSSAANIENPLRFRAKTHTELGANYFQRGQMAVALEELNEAVRLDPSYGLAHSVLGLVHADLGEDTKAEASFRRAVATSPDEGDIHNNYGSYLCRQNKPRDGIAQFEAALRLPLYGTPQTALENAGSCALRAGLIVPAQSYYARLVQIQPISSRGYQGLAAIALKTSDMPEVRRQVGMGMRANPLTPELLFYGACAERKLGDRSAEETLTMMLRSRFSESPLNEALRKGGCE